MIVIRKVLTGAGAHNLTKPEPASDDMKNNRINKYYISLDKRPDTVPCPEKTYKSRAGHFHLNSYNNILQNLTKLFNKFSAYRHHHL